MCRNGDLLPLRLTLGGVEWFRIICVGLGVRVYKCLQEPEVSEYPSYSTCVVGFVVGPSRRYPSHSPWYGVRVERFTGKGG